MDDLDSHGIGKQVNIQVRDFRFVLSINRGFLLKEGARGKGVTIYNVMHYSY